MQYKQCHWLALLCLTITLYLPGMFIPSGNAKTLTIYSDDGPPHMFAAQNNGIDIDIARMILKDMGYQSQLKFSSLKRGMEQVREKQADLFLPTFLQQDGDGLFYSAPFIRYRPTIFTLKKKNLTINSIADLYGLRTVTFQGARGYFGDIYIKATDHNNYFELHDMSKFPELLLMGRYDVVVLDYYIFYYYLKMYQEQSEMNLYPLVEDYSSLIQRHEIIPTVDAHVGFHNKELRDNFNLQLLKFNQQPHRDQIIEKYIGIISSRILSAIAEPSPFS